MYEAARARLYARQRATEGREARSEGGGVAPWEPRKTFPAYHPSLRALPPPPSANTSTHHLRTYTHRYARVSEAGHTKKVRETNVGPRDRPVTSQRTLLSFSLVLSLSLSLSFSPFNPHRLLRTQFALSFSRPLSFSPSNTHTYTHTRAH